MEKIFNHIKENMDDTVLKGIHFNEKNKENVMKAINKKRGKQRFPIKPSLNYLLSISVACLFFLGITYFISDRLGILSRDEQIASINNDKEGNQEPQNEKHLTTSINEESNKDMTKEEVVTKLLNTVDSFDTATGKMELFSTYMDGRTSMVSTEYKISLKNVFGGYEKTTVENGESMTEVIYNDKKIWRKESMGKTYRVCDYQPILSQETFTTPEEAFSVDLEKLFKPDTKLRERPVLGSRAGLTLFPYEMTSRFLRNEQLWEIEKQNEEVVGLNTIVLNGEFDDGEKEVTKDDSFRLWVDKETGILVKYEVYGNDGKINSYLHPNSLNVNVPIDPKQFIPNLDGYSEMKSCIRNS